MSSKLSPFESLPPDAFVRLPTICALYAISAPTVWRWVKSGRIPQPRKIGPQATAWVVGEVRASLAKLSEAA